MAEFNAEFYTNAFNTAHSILPKGEFQDTWSNGTGYFDNLAAKVFEGRQPFATTDTHGRKIIAVPHPEGTLVIFERYVDGQGPLITHTPRSSYHPRVCRFGVSFSAMPLMDEDAQPAQNALSNLYFHMKE